MSREPAHGLEAPVPGPSARQPRFDAVGGSLERLEDAGAIKTWPTARDGRMVAVTGPGRATCGLHQTIVADDRHAEVTDIRLVEARNPPLAQQKRCSPDLPGAVPFPLMLGRLAGRRSTEPTALRPNKPDLF